MASGSTKGNANKPPAEPCDSILLKKSSDSGSRSSKLLSHVFLEDSFTTGTKRFPLDFETIESYLDTTLEGIVEGNEQLIAKYENDSDGRIGPENVKFDINGNSGTLIVETDRLGVAGHSNFSTIRANTCIFKGKWVFELMLGAKGVMQLGWCTLGCKFTKEEGVGDTDNSFAYDGNRLRKWNMKTPLKYGESWLTGDVVSCAMDADEGTVTFYRNGTSMGEAYRNVRLGPGLAYFPAVSLSMGENLCANFGATPLRYPIAGYRSLQDPPERNHVQARHLFTYLEKLLPMLADAQETPKDPLGSNLTENTRSQKAAILLAIAHVFEKLAPYLKNAYIVESCLMKFLLSHCDVRKGIEEQPMIHLILDTLWGQTQDQEIKPCLQRLMHSVLACYRFSPVKYDFRFQEQYLVLALCILRHEKTRKQLLKHALFDKVKFPFFLHVKPPDDLGLGTLIPDVWWSATNKRISEEDEDCDITSVETHEEKAKREQYMQHCDALGERVRKLEDLQVEILKVLLINDDNKRGGASSRFIFLHKFRDYLKENSSALPRGLLTNLTPLPVSLCFFHRLIRALRFYWNQYAELHPQHAVKDGEAFVPINNFYDESISYFDIQRLGGLLSHLKKTYKEELFNSRQLGKDENGKPIPLNQALLNDREKHLQKQRALYQDLPMANSASAHSLVELLDGAFMLYNIAAHKQLSKMCSLRDSVHEYSAALLETTTKLTTCPSELKEVISELGRCQEVFRQKATEQARHMAWVIAVIYAESKQDDVYWLLRTVLNTIERASVDGGPLFAFMPDYYIDTCLNTYNALRGYFSPTRKYQTLPGFESMLKRFGLFLAKHFADSRIVNSDIKDTIVQALACFVCYPMSLKSIESIPVSDQMAMVKSLLVPYENRSWAQTNWILVRLWKGCGFGFRYKHLPHLLPAKTQQQEIGNASLQKPCPSAVFQAHVSTILHQDPDSATKLLDSLLNQLNWAFSEFVGMLQELQQIASRPTASFIDSRQLKICATCFDISVGLLRVIEMIVSLAPELLTDWTRPSAELLLSRLFQLLSQVLNRVTSSNMFDMVVGAGIPGLETVDHFPVLTAVAGIMVQLVINTHGKSQECSVAALLAEPGFQISSLEYLLGEQPLGATAASSEKKSFSLKKYEEVNPGEIEQIKQLVSHLRVQERQDSLKNPEVDEETLCEICYARPKSAVFKPCGHLSCRACISHHMMAKKDCFFCKTQIESVSDLKSGSQIT